MKIRAIKTELAGANDKRRLEGVCANPKCGKTFITYTDAFKPPKKCKECLLTARRERHRRRQERQGRTVNPRGPAGKPRDVGLALIDFAVEVGKDRGLTSLSAISQAMGFTPSYIPGVAARIYRSVNQRTTIPTERYQRMLVWLGVAPESNL